MIKKALNQTKKASLVFLLFFGLNAAKAQTQKVSGSVKDKSLDKAYIRQRYL